MVDKWYQEAGFRKCGLYYEGFIDGDKLSACLERHRRETASTFGTRKSSRLPPLKDNSENVCSYPVQCRMNVQR